MFAARLWTSAVAVIVYSLLSACGSTQTAGTAAKSQWVGQPSDMFFAKYGAPKREFTQRDGGKIYFWGTVAMPSGVITQVACTADIVANKDGLITEIRLQEDTIGVWNVSRCAEIFG